ncbi:TrbI/VirB10 family protein [Qipengyuania sp. JC766]|uniref:TrbI/VirB10 family protein n=1 Tax=Qipengyuania sp. JC766 TaxID=3232139 RepID=UPI0034593F4C
MRLAMRMPEKKSGSAAGDVDPRENQSAEIIDLASRNSYPAVARKGGSDGLTMAVGIGVVALLGAAAFWGMSTTRTAGDEAQAVGGEGVAGEVAAQQVPAVPVSQVPIQQPVDGSIQPVGNVGVGQADPVPSPIYATSPTPRAGPVGNPNASPTLVFDAGGAPIGSVAIPAAAVAAAGSAEAQQSGAGGAAGDFASRIGGVGGGPAQATAMVNPGTTVTQGTLIPAILETAIDTNVPGFTRAVVSQDVRSFDGKRVLIPRSSRLIGQYQSGLQNGQKRAYVIWTRLIRPDGASVNLQSPAVAFDGTTGLRGKVNSNFFQRFGSALLLSVVEGAAAVASGGASLVIGGGSSAASAALQQDGQIGPTIRVRQGEPIRVFTARDLDFSGV